MIKKKSWIYVIGAAFVLVVAAGWSLYAQEVGGSRSFSLKESVEIALENNPLMAIAEIDFEKASVSLDEAKAANLLNASPVSLKNAELGYTVAQEGHELAKKRVVLSVQSSYYGLLIAGEVLNISRKSLDLATENLRISEDKFRLGSANELAVIGSRAALAKASEDLTKSESNFEKSRLTFLKNLQLDLKSGVDLSEDEFPFESWSVDVNDLVNQALARRIELVQSKTNIEIAKLQVDLADNSYTPPTTLKKAQLDQAKGEITLDQQFKDISFEVQSSYLDLIGSESSVKTASENVKQSEENFRTLQINYDQGIVTKAQVDSAEIGMLNAANALRSTIFSYNNSRLNLMITVSSSFDEFLARVGLQETDVSKGGE